MSVRVVPIHERLEAFAMNVEASANELETAESGCAEQVISNVCRRLRMAALAMYTEARIFRENEQQLNTEKVG